MNASKITVRLDAAQQTAELEILSAHSHPSVEGLAEAFGRLGVRQLCTIELSTPRYRIDRSRWAERDGSRLSGARVLQLLTAARELHSASTLRQNTRRVASGMGLRAGGAARPTGRFPSSPEFWTGGGVGQKRLDPH